MGHDPTARGFEPLRAEPNGFLVHHLNHSVTLSCAARNKTEIFNNVSGVAVSGVDSKTQEQVKRQATLRPAVSKQLSGNVPGAGLIFSEKGG